MRYLLIIAMFLIFTGCSSKSPHTRFISDMGAYMTDYNDYKKEKGGDRRLDDKYLVSKSYNHNGDNLYHFKLVNKINGCICKYYIVVDKKGTIIGWGFDPCDRKKCCRIVG